MKAPAYLESIMRLWQSGMIPRGQVVHVDITHDADCAMMAGVGVCDCKPLVTVPREVA